MGGCACIKQEKSRSAIKRNEFKTESNIRKDPPVPQASSPNPPRQISEPEINLVYAQSRQYPMNQPRWQPTNSRVGRPTQSRIMTVEQASEVDEVSSTISQLQRRRERQQSMAQEQNAEPQQISQLQLLFFLFRALRRHDLSEQENAILFFRLLALLDAEPQAQGLSKQQIDRLQIRQASNSDENCPVCQDTIKFRDNLMVLPCQHMFHPDCITPWLQKSSKCPVCRGTAAEQN